MRAREDVEERVALRVNLVAFVLSERRPQQLLVLSQDLCIAAAELPNEPG